ncbi:MAG: histidine phosphatase family protein [Phycisphaerales bacterium]|nr:histidine phosphatase family protein [Phycisphaerales bacterium]
MTTWDTTGRCSGTADLPLCPEGRKSVEACAGQVQAMAGAGVMTSPDTASLETATVIAARVGGKVRVVEGWAEPGMGLWEGQSDEELAERFPKAYRQWKQDPTGVSIPEAEAVEDAQTRIVEEFARVVGRRRIGQDRATIAVLRPMALGLVVCWLEHRPVSELWAVVAGLGTCRKVEVDRARLKRPRNGSLVSIEVRASAGAGR